MNAHALSMSYLGSPGHLVTIGDAAENAFVAGLIGGTAWTGGYQDLGDPLYVEPGGAWKWQPGCLLPFTNWAASEPDDDFGQGDFLQMNPGGEWRDFYQRVNGLGADEYVIEFDVGSGAECGLGTNYCPLTPNSAGAGAVLDASGSASVAANNLVLGVSGVAPNEPGVFFYGPAAIQAPFGEGNRCVGGAGAVRLWPPNFAGPGGGNYRAIDNTSAAIATSSTPIVPATTLYFQYWFRDPAFGGTGFNLSDGLEITFGP